VRSLGGVEVGGAVMLREKAPKERIALGKFLGGRRFPNRSERPGHMERCAVQSIDARVSAHSDLWLLHRREELDVAGGEELSLQFLGEIVADVTLREPERQVYFFRARGHREASELVLVLVRVEIEVHGVLSFSEIDECSCWGYDSQRSAKLPYTSSLLSVAGLLFGPFCAGLSVRGGVVVSCPHKTLAPTQNAKRKSAEAVRGRESSASSGFFASQLCSDWLNK